MSAVRPLRLGLLLLGGGVFSCSLLVGGEPEPMRCSLEGQVGPPACDAGFTCRDGICLVILAAGGVGGEAPSEDAASGEGAGGSRR